MSKLQRIINYGGLVLGIFAGITMLALAQSSTFRSPTAAPPGGNTAAPLNVGGTAQFKDAGLGLGGDLNIVGDYLQSTNAGGTLETKRGMTLTCASGQTLLNKEVSGGIITDAECVDGGIGAPSGAIMMFDTACPAGWTRFASLDGLLPLGSTSFGTRGGAADINSMQTTATNWPQGAAAPANGHDYRLGDHVHSVTPPPYLTVVWCKKN